jgi:hypothetical protein
MRLVLRPFDVLRVVPSGVEGRQAMDERGGDDGWSPVPLVVSSSFDRLRTSGFRRG